MKELYRVKGYLNSGFTGQITYTVCLPAPCKELIISLAFDKQHYTNLSEVPQEEIIAYCQKEYGMNIAEEEKEHLFLNDMKTEIHLLATLNDTFIGCIHKQLTQRSMHFSPHFVTEGCIMPNTIEGVLKVTVLAFHVLLDDTPYEVTVSTDCD